MGLQQAYLQTKYKEHDSLVFSEAKVEQIRHLRAILTIFEAASGLHVNWSKSSLFAVNKVDDMGLLAANLGCQVGSLPTKYLGMPLGAKSQSLEIWNDVVERYGKRLASWKRQYLSRGGD